MKFLRNYFWGFLAGLLILINLVNVNAQSCSITASGTSNWSSYDWTCTGGGSDPVTDGATYNEDLTVNGLGNGEILYVDISVTIGGVNDLTVTANGSNPTIRIRTGKTLRITGNLINSNNNVQFYVEAGAFLIVDGTLNGNQNNMFGGPGTISGGTLNLGNNAGCIGGDCPTISFPNCTATGTFCADNNSACIKTNTISGDSTICSGISIDLTATTPTAGSGTYTYQWERSTTSATTGFSNAPGASTTGSPYSTGALTQTSWYRRVVTDAGATPACLQPNTSNVIQITVTPSVAITDQPSAASLCANSPAGFTVTATGTSLTYQWQENISGTWSNIADGGIYSGANTTSLAISSASAAMSGYQYRAVVTGSCGSQTSNAVTLSVSPSTGGWLGATSTNWATASNWCGGVPVSTTDVTLVSGPSNMPTVSLAAAEARDLTINNGATLTVNGNTLTINGNLTINSGGSLIITSNAVTVNGTITVNSGGTLTVTGTLNAKGAVANGGAISGAGAMILNGAVSQSISGSGTFGNVTLNNGAGCVASSAITISGYLTLTSGQFISLGNLTINLNAGGIAGSGSGSILGIINTKKSVPSTKYHYISSPFLGANNFTQWNDDITISLGQYKNLYYYNESVVDADKAAGWTPVGSVTDLIQSMKGYAMYFNSATVVLDESGTYTHGATPSNVSLSNNPSAVTGSDGWHLIGNPYPSTLDWDAAGWTKTNVGSAIYFWDPANDRYATYVGGIGTNGGTQYIPAMQAYWVKVSVSGGTGTLGMTNNVRSATATTPSLWRVAAQQNTLKLGLKSSIAVSDETVIRFSEDANNDFDYQTDAFKKKNTGNTPSLYTKIGKNEYAINSLRDTLEKVSIPLHLSCKLSGSYTIVAMDIANFDNTYDIILEDRLLNKNYDLRANPEYTFQANPTDTTGRFLIHFGKFYITLAVQKQHKSNVSIYGNEHTVYFDFANVSSNDGFVGVYNILGEPVSEVKNADISSGKYNLELPGQSGIFLVKVSIGEEVFTGKVFLK